MKKKCIAFKYQILFITIPRSLRITTGKSALKINFQHFLHQILCLGKTLTNSPFFNSTKKKCIENVYEDLFLALSTFQFKIMLFFRSHFVRHSIASALCALTILSLNPLIVVRGKFV